MSVFAAIGAYNRGDDWLVSLIGLFVAFLIIYPLYVLFLRYRHMRRIKTQLVTSMYKLPITMTPVELAYIFSAKVKKPQLYATLLNLANRSILLMKDNHGTITVENGPKVESSLRTFEKLLIKQIDDKHDAVNVELVINGFTSYDVSKEKTINGSRQYVFWWLLRENLRERNIIQRNLSKRYAMMLVLFGGIGGLLISVLTVTVIRFIQMISSGEVDAERIIMSISSGITFWFMAAVPLLIVSFGLLKYRGRMLGRDWIMTDKYRRYLGQMDAFREFVRLTHKDALRFESKELRSESISSTRPYAIACGYIKK